MLRNQVCSADLPERSKAEIYLTASALLIVLVLISFLFWHFSRSKPATSSTFAANHTDPVLLAKFARQPDFAASSRRAVFAYSVIPGGVNNAQELQNALRHDPVTAAHYADFNTGSIRAIRLAADRQGYVSYRMGTGVYWTSHKVSLHAGEMLLSDGTHLARTRCGNRISDVKIFPTNTAEPSEETLNTPTIPRLELTPDGMPFPALFEPQSLPAPLFSSSSMAPPGAPGGGFFVPWGPIFCCGTSGSSKTPPATPPTLPVTTPPVGTPEPGTFVTLSFGLAALALLDFLQR